MTEDLRGGLAWFELTEDEMRIGATRGPTTFAEGFDRVLGYARDACARPHDSVPRDLLAIESREMAELLVRIAFEDGDARFLGRVLDLLVRRIAGQEPQDVHP